VGRLYSQAGTRTVRRGKDQGIRDRGWVVQWSRAELRLNRTGQEGQSSCFKVDSNNKREAQLRYPGNPGRMLSSVLLWDSVADLAFHVVGFFFCSLSPGPLP